MDISTLSKQLNMSSSQLRFKIRQAGFRVNDRANKIDNQLAKQILNALSPKAPVKEANAAPKEVKLPKVMSVKEFAQILSLDITTVIKQLIANGVLASINEEIDYDTAAIVASDLGFNVSEQQATTTRLGIGHVAEVMADEEKSDAAKFTIRPPIVAVMGHVDHGKTSLLDTIRKTKIAETEAGRITQHIGAYQVLRNGKPVTFLDTPGHEAFSAMRARGANVTDIIVLVVAADDGVKPQTIEVINRAKVTSTPLIVAINKIDKPDANPERVKKELGDFGVLIEEWGGTVPVAMISGLTGQGVDDLLDLILLQAEVLDLKANPDGQTLGTVIEANKSKTKGSVATILIQNGTLKVGEIVAVGKAFGKIRTMEDAVGKKLKEAKPAYAVQITGLSEVPSVGDILKTYTDLETAKLTAAEITRSDRAKKMTALKRMVLTGKDLNLIIKVDVQGSLEAITEALNKLKNTEIKINIIDEGVGEINENDVLRATAANAQIIGFHARVSPQAAKLAQAKKTPILLYDIIYELVEDLTKQVIDMMTPEVLRFDLGLAKVLAIFRTEKEKMIIGGTVLDGKVKENSQFEIKREGEIIGKGALTELQQNKSKAKEVAKGFEFGASVKTSVTIAEGDNLSFFEESIKKKTLV